MWSYQQGKTFLTRLPHDGELLDEIKAAFLAQGIETGWFSAIGAVKKTNVAFYDQLEKVYKTIPIDEPAEILSCIGNVSELDGQLFVHAHITLGLQDGLTKGGHLLEGTVIFSCELFGVGLEGENLPRRYDDVTGLKLWKP
jgi:predicted DNA-binding protein with PD1-like motif